MNGNEKFYFICKNAVTTLQRKRKARDRKERAFKTIK
jgi:hypothetical protein